MGAVVIPNNLPVGYRFHPTDEEFIDHYLKNRDRGLVDCPCIIPDVDFCEWDPWQLPHKFHGESIIRLDDKVQEWWFFSPQTPQQVKRSTPSGYWKKTGKDRNVRARDTNRVIGTKKTLVFHLGRGSGGVRTNWVIHEYHLLTKDSNRNYVLCRLKYKRDEKADDSTIELELGAILADLVSVLHQPDHEDSFPESLIQAFSRDLLQLLQPASVGDVTFQSGPPDPRFWPTIELQMSIAPEEKKGLGENKTYGSCVAPEKPMLPPSVKCCSKDEEPRFEKVKQETPAKSIKPECISLDETATGAKHGQIYTVENHQTPTIESLPRGFRFEEMEGVIQSEFNSSHVSSAKPMELLKEPETPKRAESPRIHGDEEQTFEKVKKQEFALKNVKPECVAWDESAATAKVLDYEEHVSAGSSPKRTNSEEIEHAREKSNLVTALARPTTKNTKNSTNPPLLNLVNVLVGIFLLIAITAIFTTILPRVMQHH